MSFQVLFNYFYLVKSKDIRALVHDIQGGWGEFEGLERGHFNI